MEGSQIGQNYSSGGRIIVGANEVSAEE